MGIREDDQPRLMMLSNFSDFVWRILFGDSGFVFFRMVFGSPVRNRDGHGY